MSKFILSWCLFTIFILTFHNISALFSCPTYPIMEESFTINKFLGKWFTFKHDGDYFRESICPNVKFEMKQKDGRDFIEIENRYFKEARRNLHDDGPVIYYLKMAEYGELVWKNVEKENDYKGGIIKYQFDRITKNNKGTVTDTKKKWTEEIRVVDTDYKHYAIVSACDTVGFAKREVVSLLTRIPKDNMTAQEIAKYERIFNNILKEKMKKSIDSFKNNIYVENQKCYPNFDRSTVTDEPWNNVIANEKKAHSNSV